MVVDALEFSKPEKGRNQNADGGVLVCKDAAGCTGVQDFCDRDIPQPLSYPVAPGKCSGNMVGVDVSDG